MSNLPIQFQDKENSPALLAYLQQFGEKSYLSAEEINQIRDAINELAQGSLPDAVLKTGTISITGLAVNLAANAFAWRINQQSFLNPPSYDVNLTAAANGFYRADIIVGTSTGVQGNPSATTAIEPNTPEGTIRLAGVVVFGMVVGQPTPTPTTNFIQKSERANVVLTGSGVINQLDLVDEKATIVFKDAITRLNTISYASVPYNGKRITLFNAQATPVTIGNSVSGYGVDFVFPDGQDYVLQPNQTIEFSFDMTYAPYAHHMLIGAVVDSQIEVNSSTYVLATWDKKTVLFTANCTITVPATLLSQFGFVFRTLAGVTVTWAITAPFTWETTPTTTPEKTTGSFMRRGSTNTILLDF